jgi:hypothetical protein
MQQQLGNEEKMHVCKIEQKPVFIPISIQDEQKADRSNLGESI